MKTDFAFDVMEKILPDVAELMNDDEVKLSQDDFKEGAKVGDMMNRLMPVFITKHRAALYNIVGAISGKTSEDVAAQDWSETLKTFMDGFTEGMFVFFICCLRLARRA